jgi:hypothetical protein
MSDAWYFDDGGRQVGPLGIVELTVTLATYPDPRGMFVWRAGFEDWKMAGDVWELANLLPPTPPSFPATVKADLESRNVGVPLVAQPDNRLPEATRTRQYNNFIAKNWRGEYPLGVTYWIFGFLGNVVVGVILVIVVSALSVNTGYQPGSSFAAVVMIWLTVGAYAIWQLVAVWRSASRRIQERTLLGKRAPWARLAMFAVVIGFLRLISEFSTTGVPQLIELSRMAFIDDPSIPAYSIRIMRNGTEAEITGGFKYGLTDDFLKLFARLHKLKWFTSTAMGEELAKLKV